MSDGVVVDSSAVLALLREEAGADAVARTLAGAAISAVNVAEVLMVLERHGMPRHIAEAHLAALVLRVIPADERLAVGAARVASGSRGHGLSLGDCFCLATAQALGVRAVTADRAWTRLSVGVKVTVVR